VVSAAFFAYLIPRVPARQSTFWRMTSQTPNSPAAPGVVDLQLLLVRSTIDRARIAASENTAIGSMTAMLLADVAVETISKVACYTLNINIGDGANLAAMITPLQTAVPALAGPEVREAQRHRRNRNLIQHQGHVPDAQMVAASVTDAERFCALVVREVFAREFSEVSSVALVRHDQLRSILVEAVASLQTGDRRRAVVFALAGFDFLHFTWARALRLADGYDESHDAYRSGTVSPFLATIDVALFMPNPDDENPYPTLARTSMGMSIDELIRVRLLQKEVDARLRKNPPEEPDVTSSDVRFVVEVVARAGWRLETAHPDLLELTAPMVQRVDNES
jgi:hypothetical protein